MISSVLRNSGFLIVAASVHCIEPKMSVPFLCASIAQISTCLFLRVFEDENKSFIVSLQHKVYEWDQKYKWSKTTSLLSAIALSHFFTPASYIIAIPLGVYCGLCTGLDFYKIHSEIIQNKKNNTEKNCDGCIPTEK